MTKPPAAPVSGESSEPEFDGEAIAVELGSIQIKANDVANLFDSYIGMFRRKMTILTASMAVILCLITEGALLLGIGGGSAKPRVNGSEYDPPKVITIPGSDFESEINRGESIVPESGNKGSSEKHNGRKDEKKPGSSPVFSNTDDFHPV